MDLKVFIKKITKLENSFNVSEVNCFDFNPWPYIRLKIINRYSLATGNVQERLNQSFVEKLKSLYISFVTYIKNPIRKEPVDIVYFTGLSESNETLKNKRFNRHAGGFYELFFNRYKIKTLEINDTNWVGREGSSSKNITNIEFIINITKIKHKLLLWIRTPYLLSCENLNIEIEKEFGFQVPLTTDLVYLNMLSQTFMRVMKEYKPKLVFLTVFYRPEAMAMSLACHRLGIRVVEYQHGAQNNYHYMYTNWTKIPKRGYELVPDVFWMWGSASQDRIDSWSRNTTKHKAIVGGNLWMTYCRRFESKVEIEGLREIYNKNQTNILVSLQGDEYFAEYLIDNIEKSSKDICWHFRDHPRLTLSKELRRKLLSYPNTELVFSSEAPLYELLKVTDIHITGYSTVAFEAQSFLVPTIFTHENARNGFGALTNKNGLYYADNSTEMMSTINKLLSVNDNIVPDYIVSDINVSSKALDSIIKGL